MNRSVPRIALRLLAVSLLCLALSGCNPSVAFDVTIDVTTKVEGATLLENLVGDLGFSGFLNVDFSTTQEFKNNNVAKEHVKSAKLSKLLLKITAPDDQNFDFLEKIEFYVEAPGLEKKLVATKTVPKGSKEINFDITNVDLAPYVKAEKVSFTTKVNGRKPKKETTIQAIATFAITAQLFKGEKKE